MEQLLRGDQHILIFIDDLIVHKDTQDKHLQVLEQVFTKLQKNHLNIELDKCFFGKRRVPYLGFTLIQSGIKPGEAKLLVIWNALPPINVKSIHSFVGLCNFFQNHIQNFVLIADMLFKLTQDTPQWPYQHSILSFSRTAQLENNVSFPRVNCNHVWITNATSPTNNLPNGLHATLTQAD